MTLRLAFGVDPGTSGAIAVVADGEPIGFFDMPTEPRASGNGRMVDGRQLGALLRGAIIQHRGAHVVAVIERVQAMPTKLHGREQGATSTFNFGQADGIARGVIRCLGIPVVSAEPSVWKRHNGLIKAEKSASVDLVLRRFPALAESLARVKDHGRAEALLIALWAHETEQFARGAA
jgi:Holliday junction resolvasome RuvABC endonuclease subunit